MQEQYPDGTYSKPTEVTDEELKKKLGKLDYKEVRKILLFAAHDENGEPTKELRRAWRRYKRNKHKGGSP